MSQEISQLRREQWTNPNVGRRPRFAAHRAGTKAAVRGTCSCVVKQGSLLLLGNCWDWHAVPVGSRASTLAGIWSCLVYVRAQVAADLRGLPVSRTGAGAGHAAGLECWGWAHCQERCLCIRLARQWLHGGEGQSLVPPPRQTEGWGHPRYTPPFLDENMERDKYYCSLDRGTCPGYMGSPRESGAPLGQTLQVTGHADQQVGEGKDSSRPLFRSCPDISL